MRKQKEEDKEHRRKSIPKKVRQKVYEKYDGHCAYCGKKLEYKDMQVDHIQSHYHSFTRRLLPLRWGINGDLVVYYP